MFPSLSCLVITERSPAAKFFFFCFLFLPGHRRLLGSSPCPTPGGTLPSKCYTSVPAGEYWSAFNSPPITVTELASGEQPCGRPWGPDCVSQRVFFWKRRRNLCNSVSEGHTQEPHKTRKRDGVSSWKDWPSPWLFQRRLNVLRRSRYPDPCRGLPLREPRSREGSCQTSRLEGKRKKASA